MKKQLTVAEIQSLTRKEAFDYCVKYKIPHRDKDDTARLKRKIELFLFGKKNKPSIDTSSKKTKSTSKPKAKRISSKKILTWKQIGANINVIINNKPYTRRILDKSERESVKALLTEYNKKNSNTLFNQILDVFTQKSKEKKFEKKVVEKKIEALTNDKSIDSLLHKISDPKLRKELASEIGNKLASHKPKEYASKTTSKRTGEY